MHFFKSISTLFTGALLATSAVAAPTHKAGRDTNVDKRGPAPRILACHAAVEALGRKLRARDPVDMSDLGRGSGDKSLDTHGLSDCIGIAVTLDRAEGDEGDDRWLLHYATGDNDQLQKLQDAVADAKSKGAQNVEVQVVHPKAETQTPPLRGELEGDIKKVMDAANSIAGTTIVPVTHDITKGYSMSISGDKTINEPTDDGEWMNEKQKAIYDKEMRGEEVTDEEYKEAYGEDFEDGEYDPED